MSVPSRESIFHVCLYGETSREKFHREVKEGRTVSGYRNLSIQNVFIKHIPNIIRFPNQVMFVKTVMVFVMTLGRDSSVILYGTRSDRKENSRYRDISSQKTSREGLTGCS